MKIARVHQAAAREAKLDAENQHLRAELKRSRDFCRHLGARIQAISTARPVRVCPKARTKSRGEHVRVIIPDSHGSAIDPEAAGAMLADLKGLNPTEIVMLGDHVDCGGFLAQHHTLGYVAETEYSYEEDIASANHFLDQIQAAAPRAAIHYIEGNHERRVETWCVTQTLRHQKDCEMLRRALAPEFLLRLEQRGIRYYRQSTHYGGISVPGTIRLGKCYFWHGTSTAQEAARANLRKIGGNVVYGHTHREDESTGSPVNVGDISAWCPGCLCRRQPLWNHTRPSDWTHGYGLQIVNASGLFLHINVRIIGGQSLMMPMLNAGRR